MRHSGESAPLQVRLFGSPTVRRRGTPVRLSPLQHALAILVYGHGPRGISRPEAARLLWGRAPDAKVRHKIRQLLVEIRKKAGRGLVCSHGDSLLACPGVGSDLAEFEAALRRGDLLAAAELARHGFVVASFRLGSDGFEDWRAGKEKALLRALRVRASLAWQTAFDEGAWASAHQAAEALFALDPSDPQVVERVIESRGRTGRFREAEAAFSEYLESSATGEGPAEPVLQALERVQLARDAEARAAHDAPCTVPFIGREAPLAAARWVFGEVETGRFGFVLVVGESGIGKTRLLRELQREAAFRGIRCLAAQPVELEQRIPLNPLLDALSTVDLRPHLKALGAPWDAVIGTMLPAGALDEPPGELPAIQESALPRRLLDAFALLLERLAEEQPTLLLIDDLQWADATTIAALQFVQRRWNQGPLGVIAAVRPELVGPSEAVSQYLTGGDGLDVQRVELGELSPPEAAELIHHIGHERISEETGLRISALAGLHPLYLTELARDYLAGRLQLPELPEDEVTVPMSLQQILDARLCNLTDEALKLAGLLAVAARPLRLSDLAELLRRPIDVVADLTEELQRARLVEVERDRVRISHELFRSAIYRHLSEAHRAVHHMALAAYILATGSGDSAGPLATHFSRAGDMEKAAHHGRAAASRAMASGAVAEAAHFYRLVTENERDALLRAEATAGLARALHLTRDITRANPQLELAASRLRAAGRPREALRMEIRRVEGLAEVGAASLKELLERLDGIKTEARGAADWEGLALALDAELHLLHRDGDLDRIRGTFNEMRAVTQSGCVEATLLAHAGLALGVLFEDPDQALLSARRALSLTTPGMSYRLLALLRLMVVLQYRGMLAMDDSVEIVAEARALASDSGDLRLRFSIESNLASAALDAGDLDAAEVLMTRSTALLGAAEMDLNRFNQANNLAELALARGDYEAAEQAFCEGSQYLGPTTPAYMMDLVNAGMGLCALEMGDLAKARRREERLGEPPGRWYFDPTTLLAFRARLLERRGRPGDAIALLARHAADLEDRLVLAWLKVRGLQARLMARQGDSGATEIAQDARARAIKLELHHRVNELSTFLAGVD